VASGGHASRRRAPALCLLRCGTSLPPGGNGCP
jgi:hypothetical protein